jgi:hypothetical protein
LCSVHVPVLVPKLAVRPKICCISNVYKSIIGFRLPCLFRLVLCDFQDRIPRIPQSATGSTLLRQRSVSVPEGSWGSRTVSLRSAVRASVPPSFRWTGPDCERLGQKNDIAVAWYLHDLSGGMVMQIHPTVSRQQTPCNQSKDEAVPRDFGSHRFPYGQRSTSHR